MKKKVWSKPKLVVLVRGKPQEAVLNGCKLDYPLGGTGADAVYSGCFWIGGEVALKVGVCNGACDSLLDT